MKNTFWLPLFRYLPCFLTAAVMALLSPLPCYAATRNVPAQYVAIQAAVNAAVNGDTVLVADGTYSGNGNRDIDFGGKNITVTSQHGAASTIIDCGGSPSKAADTGKQDGKGSHRGFYIHRGETRAIIRGFTVKNGYEACVDDIIDSYNGGGICIDGSSAMIQDCIISGNIANFGAGISINIHNSSTITLTGCTISNNTAKRTQNFVGGGAMGSAFWLAFVSVFGSTYSYGEGGGGGVFIRIEGGHSTVTMTNDIIYNNTAPDCFEGGGIYYYVTPGRDTIPHDTNPFAHSIGEATLTNCTICDNSAFGVGDGIYCRFGAPIMTNDIVYCKVEHNVRPDVITGGWVTDTYSDIIAPPSNGTGNIHTDPLFVDEAGGDLHLRNVSPCLGAGTPTGAPATDKDGKTRPNPPSMGAYELGDNEQ